MRFEWSCNEKQLGIMSSEINVILERCKWEFNETLMTFTGSFMGNYIMGFYSD